mgnify:CR=1 FL=1
MTGPMTPKERRATELALFLTVLAFLVVAALA